MKKLLPYLRPYRLQALLAPLFKLLEATLELFVPLVMAAVIDRGIEQADSGYIWRMGGVLVALGALGLAVSVTAQYFAAKAAVGFATDLRSDLFRHIQGFSYTQVDTQGSATLITRMTNDINQLQNGVNMTLRLVLRSPFVVLGALVMALTINWQAALVFAVAIPLLAVAVALIMWLTMPLYKRVQARLDTVLGTTRENLTGVRVLRAFNRQPAEQLRFAQQHEELTRAQLFVGRLSALMNPLTYVILGFATLVLLQTGGRQVAGGAITQGQMVALVNYMSQILVELIKAANLVVTLSKAAASGARVSATLAVVPAEADRGEGRAVTPVADAPAVEFRAVGAEYENAGAESLSDITLRAKPGQTIGVIGGTGSGKSTLVNLIPRFYDATRGQVLVQGIDVQNWPLAALRDTVRVVPQKALLFAGTLRQNLCWAKPDASDEELLRAVELAQAGDVLKMLPDGLDTEVEQGGKNFSGGQRQRLTIARALVGGPAVLILDDSASALDFATDAALRAALRGLPGAPCTFIVSQRAASVLQADCIVVLDDGNVVGMGTSEELLHSCPVYREIYDSQFGQKEAQQA